jgi:hypothetical protein
VNAHAAAAQTAHDASLQQSGTFSRRTTISFGPDRLGRCAHLLLGVLKLLPRDVSGVSIADQHQPLVLREPLKSRSSIGLLAYAATTVDVGARVPRVMKRACGAAQGQC